MGWVSPSKLVADKKYVLNGITINEYLLAKHNENNINLPTKRTHNFKGVVIHNTNPAQSADDGRQYTAATLNGNVASRTHYYVTNLGAWKNLDDSDMNWTCGDGTTGNGNNGCISLEIIMGSKGSAVDLKARDNGAKLAAYMLFINHMTVNDMYTHNYFLNIRNGVQGDYYTLCTKATPTRNCPYYIVWDWEGFRKQVDGYIKQLGGKSIYNEVADSKNIYVATSKAAIRTQPNKLAKIVDRVVKGDYYPGSKVKENWMQHLSSGYYSMLNDGGALFTKVGEYEQKTTTTKVNIRSGPTTKSSIILTVNAGTILITFIDKGVMNEGHEWKKVVINNKLGYIAGEYLK